MDKDAATVAIAGVAALVAALSAWFSFVTARGSLLQQSNEDEIADIQATLQTFYGPLIQMLQADHLLAQDLRDRQQDATYRLLGKLFDAAWLAALPRGDRALIGEVCANALQLETFIREHIGMVEYTLLPYFARASGHFRILHLAYEGKLGSDPTRFARYVYPTAFDPVLRLEVERLIARRDDLRRRPAASHPPVEPLRVPRDLALDPWPNPGGTRLPPV